MKYQAYPAYKDSGVEWLGKIPAGWAVSKVGFGYLIQLGKMLQPDSKNDTNLLVSYLRAQNVQWEGIDTAEVKEMWATESEVSQFRVHRGDLLICEGGEAGRSMRVHVELPEGCIIQNSLHRVRSVLNDVGFLDFYMRFMSATGWLDVLCNKSTIVHFTGEKLSALRLPLPPLTTQQAIATFLDTETARIDGLIQDYEELVVLLQEKRQALISHAVTRGLSELVSPHDPEFIAWAKPVKFKDSGVEWIGEIPEGWISSKLKYECSRIIDCPHETPVYDPEGDFMVIRTADIELGTLYEDGIYRVARAEYIDRIRRSSVDQGDIAYSREGERWGHGVVIPASNKYCLGQRMMQFKVERRNDSYYLMWQLNSRSVYEQGAIEAVGATSPHVNVETISNYAICVPELSEQQAIAAFLDKETTKMDTLVTEAESAIEFLKEHRSALITNAVTGKINVGGLV